MAEIKNIVFDFGGILINLDQSATYQAFSELLDEQITQENALKTIGPILHDLEKGLISNEAFIWKIQHKKGGNVDPVKIIKAWNKMLLDIRPEIFDFLRETKYHYRCILLSNTNAIHIRYVLQNVLEKIHNERNWDQYFHSIYYSHEMNMRKPDYEIFQEVIKKENIDPRETLFIDDTLENVQAALACGWHAIQHDPTEKIENKLKEYIDACGTID